LLILKNILKFVFAISIASSKTLNKWKHSEHFRERDKAVMTALNLKYHT
jgi:hypothetical protein